MSIGLKLINSFYFNLWFFRSPQCSQVLSSRAETSQSWFTCHSSGARRELLLLPKRSRCDVPGALSPKGNFSSRAKTCLDLPNPQPFGVCTDHSRWGAPRPSLELKCPVPPTRRGSNADPRGSGDKSRRDLPLFIFFWVWFQQFMANIKKPHLLGKVK